jgi:type I restriction enzyme S subunit
LTFMRLPFEAVFADESGGNIKTPQSEYLPVGAFPVVDQGKALIGGYVDDSSRLCGEGRPAIVFGDHTRCIKHVNFPFCMGADGVKVLRPKVDADLKYLYYYLRTVKLPDAGYDRHFKYLKRTEVVIPPLPEQRRIVAMLDQVDALRAKRREALAQLDHLQQAIFIETFGDPIHGKSKAPHVPFEDITTRITYGFTSPMSHLDCGVPILTAKNVRDGYLDLENVHYADQAEFDALTSKSKPNQGDILITKDGTIGRTAVVDRDGPICINQSVALVQLQTDKVTPIYVAAYLRSAAVQQVMKNMGKGNALAHLQITELAKMPVGLPSLAKQREFSERITYLAALARRQNESAMHLDSLFASLQHRAFRGEL